MTISRNWKRIAVKLSVLRLFNDSKFDKCSLEWFQTRKTHKKTLKKGEQLLSFDKHRRCFKLFTKSRSSCCAISLLFNSFNIKRLKDAAFRIALMIVSFKYLLKKDKPYEIHHQNIQRFLDEIYRIP